MADGNEIIAKLKVEGKEEFINTIKQAQETTQEFSAGIDVLVDRLKKMPEGSKEYKNLKNELTAMQIAIDSSSNAFETNTKKLNELKNTALGLSNIMVSLKEAGKQNTDTFKDIERQFKATQKEAAKLENHIKDVRTSINSMGSSTAIIDKTVSGISLMANGMELAVGVSELFGKKNKDLEQSLTKLLSVMAIANSVQSIGTELVKKDSLARTVAAGAVKLYTWAVEGSTTALKAFRLALVSLGVGAVMVAVSFLVENWEKIKNFITGAKESLEDYKKAQEGAKERQGKINDARQTEIDYLLSVGKITKQQALDKEKELSRALDSDALKEYIKQRDKYTKLSNEDFRKGLKKESEATKEQYKIMEYARYEYMKVHIQMTEKQNETLEETNKKLKKTKEHVGKIKEHVEKIKDNLPLKITNDFIESELDRLNKKLKEVEDNIISLWSAERMLGNDPENNKHLMQMLADYNALKKQIEDTKIQQQAFFEGWDTTPMKPKGLAIEKPEKLDLSNALDGLERREEQKPISLWERYFGLDPKKFKTQGELYVAAASQVLNNIKQISDGINSLFLNSIKSKETADLNVLENLKNRGVITEKEYQKKVAKVKQEAYLKERKVNIANAVMQIPMAILSAFTSTPGGPIAKAIAAAFAGAFATAQLAAIVAAPIPKFKQGGSVAKRLGLIHGAKHEQGGVPIEVEGGEYVLNSDAVRKYGVKMLDNINSLKFNPILNNASKINDNYVMSERLASIGGYLKQSLRYENKSNDLLFEISEQLKNKRNIYV